MSVFYRVRVACQCGGLPSDVVSQSHVTDGAPRVSFSPLRDIQRFFRFGYAQSPGLLGLTLSLRTPSGFRGCGDVDNKLFTADAVVTTTDIEDFVKVEARAAGIDCCLVETMAFGMHFFLFQLK